MKPLSWNSLRKTICGTAALGLSAFAAAQFSGNELMPPLRAEPTASITAPDFEAGFQWHNVDKPLSLRALRGKVVLLDFWTYGCINCIHVLPDLKKLERKYPNNLVVIGVHSAKFQNESDAANIRNALLRYNIEHPVVVDQNMRLWSQYTVRAWPTFVVIDPAGKVVGNAAGEGQYNVLDRAISSTISSFRERGLLDEKPLKFALEAAEIAPTPLWYPGKVLAREGYVFIADTNHNRIVIARPDGKVETVAGSGVMGRADGAFDEATFSSPQGLALRKGDNGELTLFVADTNNHLIRALNLNNGTVSTVAGTGNQAPFRSIGGVGTQGAISSPWDLHLIGDKLYIAMAGPHQIWSLDLNSKAIEPYAGSGIEARTDGTLRTAAFAQPSGLASDGKVLWIADSEISAIRQVDLPNTGNRVRTLAGGDLFAFGDIDGKGDNVRLQHPLGVEFHKGLVYFTDTYNHKLKTLDPKTQIVKSFVGNGRGDKSGTSAQFYEPGGLSIADGKIYVADTNNHRIKIVDIASKAVSNLELRGLPPVKAAEPNRVVRPVDDEEGTIQLEKVTLSPNSAGQIVLEVTLPKGHHLNEDSPQRVQARIEGGGATLQNATANGVVVSGQKVQLPLSLPLKTGANGKGEVVLSAAVYYCTDAGGLCKFKPLRFRAPFEIAEGGVQNLSLKTTIAD